ncbi:hypothetical protein EXIGLDRAFT_770254 [Exidia glandulosa HHB12029]|uniref:Cytochrome b mRNA-processing protein 4 n=1 Tax=Exidia glandulosa HHB12029 TaxID=1314781 RepID=A0A166AED1_EXIGL|nr:hypothetical protein EXIGLDRAFT_770254 [Exidia glandulosa HHB12029]
MSANVAWGKFALITAGSIGLGYVLMRTTTPTEEELYNRMAPDIRRKVDAMRAQRARTEAAARGEVSDAEVMQKPDPEKPNWAGR